MKLWKNGKIIGFCLLVFILSFFSFSCSKKEMEGPVTIRFSWWGGVERQEYTKDGIDLFTSQNPYINIIPETAIWNGYEESFEKTFLAGRNADVMQINFDWLYKFSEDGRLIKEGSCELADDGVFYSPDKKRTISYLHAPYILKRIETILTDEEVQSVESFYVYQSGGLRMKECTWGMEAYSENSLAYDDQANLIGEDRIFPNGEADRDIRKWKYLRRDNHGNWLGKLSSPYEVTRKITYYE